MGIGKLTMVDQWFATHKMHQGLPNKGFGRRINVGLAGLAGTLLPRLGMDGLRQHYLSILDQVTASPTVILFSKAYPSNLLDAREDAVKALGTIGNQAAIPALVKIFTNKDEDFSLRRDAAWALGRIGGFDAEKALTEELFERHSMQFGGWEAVGEALANITTKAPARRAVFEGFVHAARLIAASAGGNTIKQEAAIAALINLGKPAKVALHMIIELRYPLPEVCARAQALIDSIPE